MGLKGRFLGETNIYLQYQEISESGCRVKNPLKVVGDPRVHSWNTLARAPPGTKAYNANLQKNYDENDGQNNENDDDDDEEGKSFVMVGNDLHVSGVVLGGKGLQTRKL